MKNFNEFHCHPQSLDSGSVPKAVIKRELELGTGSICCTDHGSMAACRKVYDLARAEKIMPILGLEGYFYDPEDVVLKQHGIEDIKGYVGSYYHITLHYLNQQAYEAGCRILSRIDKNAIIAYGERKPPFTWVDLEELLSYDVTVGSGCFGGMCQSHITKHSNVELAQAYYDKLKALAKPGNFYVELFPHRLTHDWVSGVYLTFEDNSIQKLPPWKNLKIDGEKIKAIDFVKACSRRKGPYGTLEAVMENRVMVECEHKVIVKVDNKEEFVQNECTSLTPEGDLQYPGNRFMQMLAERYGDPIVISGDAHFDVEKNKIVQDIRLASGGAPWKFYASYHRQSSEEAFKYFSQYMNISQAKFESWVDNNAQWASRFKDFKFVDRKQLPAKFYPTDTLAHLKTLIDKHGRMKWDNPVWVERLNSEIELLHDNGVMDFLPYFFTAEEGVAQYEEKEILTGSGRGSAAGLLLTYLLEITHVDPLKYNLSKDRFLTSDRIKTGKFPDIDQDLPDVSILTDKETGWLERRFKDHYAQISTETTLKLKSTVKDVARALHGSVPYDVEKLAKNFEVPPQGISDKDFVFGYKKDEEWVDGSITYDEALKEYVAKYPDEWEIVQKCLGLVRNSGRHASAFCITNEPISNFIPLTEIGGVQCTAYDMRSVEAVGGIKMDYLGLNTLRDLSLAIKLIQQKYELKLEKRVDINGVPTPRFRIVPFKGELYDIWDLPHSKKVYNSICEGDSETVFQFGSPGARKWMKYFNYYKPNSDSKLLDSIEALSVFTALDRKGPLDYLIEGKHNMLVEYARRLRGEEPVGNLPILDEMLPETLGVIVFQEQLTKIFKTVGETTGVQAENFREHIGKKKMKLVFEDKNLFMPKAIEKLGEETATNLWTSLEKFAAYGFNKSHSICYSVIGYACAFLKYHYPLEWWCAVLNHADKTKINEKFWKHCSHLVLLPDINKSGDGFQIEGDKIRAPIWLLHGIAETSHQELCDGRPYKDIDDFCQKIQATKAVKKRSALNKTIICNLIITGAMDSLFPEGVSVDQKLEMFRLSTAKAGGDKKLKIDSLYLGINQYQQYQVIKQVLPMYAKPLLPIMLERGEPGVSKTLKQNSHIKAEYFNECNGSLMSVPFVDMEELDIVLENSIGIDNIKVAVAAYVLEERRFSFVKDGVKKDAVDITLEIDGLRYNYVRWPDKTGKLPQMYNQELLGSIGIFILEKYRADKPFSIIDMIQVQPPLVKGKNK